MEQYLGAVLRAYHKDHNPLWLTVLLALFWGRLLILWRRILSHDQDWGLLWITIQELFLEAVDRVRWPDGSVDPRAALWWETKNRIRTHYRPIWRQENFQRSFGVDRRDGNDEKDDWFHSLADPRSLDAFRDVEERLDREKRLALLRHCLEKGWINEAEYYVLLGVEIYTTSLADYCQQYG